MGNIKFELKGLKVIDLPPASNNLVFDYNGVKGNIDVLTQKIKELNDRIDKFRTDFYNYYNENKNTCLDAEINQAITTFYGTATPTKSSVVSANGIPDGIAGNFFTTLNSIKQIIDEQANQSQAVSENQEKTGQDILTSIKNV